MSNFQGGPYYGALPYGYNGHVPMPLPVQEGVPYGNVPQSGYPQYRNPMPMQHQQNVHPLQLSNPYAYTTNSQYSSMGVPGGAALPAPPPPPPLFQYQGYGQYPPNRPPSTSFSPASFPSHNIPAQRLAASVPLPQSSQVFQAPTSLPPKPAPPAGHPVGAVNHIPLNGTSFTAMGGNREIREQGELGVHRAVNGSILATSTAQQDNRAGHSSKPAAHPLQSDANTAHYGEAQPPESSGLKAPNEGSSGDQVPPNLQRFAAAPPGTPRQVNEPLSVPQVPAVNTSGTPPLVNGAKLQSEVPSNNTNPSVNPPTTHIPLRNPPYGNYTPSQNFYPGNNHNHQRASLREKVKSALQDLHRQHIGFESLSAEGVDVLLLRELYQDLGISIPEVTSPKTARDPSSQLTNKALSRNRSTSVTDNLSTALEAESQVPAAAQSSGTDLTPTVLPQSKPTSDLSREQHPPGQGVSDLQQESVNTSGTISPSQAPKPTSFCPGKFSSVPSAKDRALERKDYIAQMLAAKVRKGIIAKAPKPAETIKLDLNSESEQNTASTVLQSSATKLIMSDLKQDQMSIQAELEAKKKASTELARRKMEVLMTRAHEAHGHSAANPMPESPRSSQEAQVRPASRSSLPTQTVNTNQFVEAGPVSPTYQYTPETPFFAPLEQQKPMAGLPGLSMSYPPCSTPNTDPLSVALPKDIVTNEQPSSKMKSQSASAPDKNRVSAPMTTTLNREPVVSHPQLAEERADVFTSSRKRATASDFIDFQSDRTKVRVGPEGPYKLVIGDVSDDEDEFDEDAMDLDEVTELPKSEPPQLEKTINPGTKANRDLPPLSNIPAWSKTGTASSTSTPPLVPTPGKSSETEDLARAEEQIRKLKQMIAEKEERKKAKLNSSRGESPGMTTANAMDVASTPKTSPERTRKAVRTVEEKEEKLAAVRKDLEAQKTALVAAENDMQINLDAERLVQASVVAKAEEERQEAAKATTTAEREYRERRKATLEAALPELDAQIEKAMLKLDEMRKQKDELEAEIQRGSEGRKKILQELNTLLTELEIEKSAPAGQEMQLDTLGKESQLGDSLVLEPSDGLLEVFSEPNGQHTSGASVQTASPIPFISPTARSMTPPTQSSRDGSPDEIMEISSDGSDEGQINDLDPETSPNQQMRPDSEMDDDEYEPQLETDILIQQLLDRNASTPAADHSSTGTIAPNAMQADQGNVDHAADTSLVDRSSVEEGEISGSMSADDGGDSDDYEPPEPVPAVDYRAASEESEAFSPKPPSSHEEDGQVISEPLAAVAVTPVVDLTGDMSTGSSEGPLGNHSKTTTTLKQSGRFTPYESPLKTFHSYRYHPKYVSDVPGGFRSLTYSHNINSNEPLCRWELAGGTCNDGSCNYQHFRSMPLTDDMILVQLGSTREGTTPEEEQKYVSGLKQMIYGMRSKHITDFELVAKEIAGYRSSFLGDSTRVLTHITP